jgi:hypothetical protein
MPTRPVVNSGVARLQPPHRLFFLEVRVRYYLDTLWRQKGWILLWFFERTVLFFWTKFLSQFWGHGDNMQMPLICTGVLSRAYLRIHHEERYRGRAEASDVLRSIVCAAVYMLVFRWAVAVYHDSEL